MKFAIAFLSLWFIFGILEWLFPLRKEQKHFRQGWLTDVAHFFFNHILINVGTYLIAVILYIFFKGAISPALQTAVRSQPIFLQFAEAFFIAQLSFYFVHRLAHQNSWLWRFHAIHHSSAELDWLASARLHPVEMIVVNLAVGVPLFLLGFTRETFGAYLIFGAVLPILNHSNTRFQFPYLNRIIATPEFHHWHHSNDREARDKNFSGFPIIDLMFGTYYLPKNKMPQTYGVDEVIPQTYWQHLLYPFK
ncbi:sterol desaturase family protein [Pseudanabaena sp. FACHB-1998]|uniref:sterol desaturase family protein n=1 Tax=Pseudanabaena sp. FACHB-1998 TaxID=2692858 RepID=UPI0016803BA4|nr:sterol desaturase family protein [Pseudanabaena sp. FACHB-1998]MBD2178366.1 sterol desaturase family protein [Pseudanabaena sp. FACHB-1998]